MKRITLSLIVVALCGSLFAQSGLVTSGKFVYQISGNSAVIVSLTESGITDIRIPSSVKVNDVKYPVTAIADDAFSNQTNLLSVSLGLNINRIGEGAFVGCPRLTTVYVYALEPPACSANRPIFGFDNGSGTIVLPQNFKVYVSSGSVADFQTAAGWSRLPIAPMQINF